MEMSIWWLQLLTILPQPSLNLTVEGSNITFANVTILNSTFIPLGASTHWNSSVQDTSIGNMSVDGTTFFNIASCYGDVRNEHCKMKFSLPIILVVIACNASKAICMAITYWYTRESTLDTLGDAIASFLDNPDPTTTGLCLVSKEDIQNHVWSSPRRPKMWKPIEEKAFYSANTKRWVIVKSIVG